jgi:hypothetical protein
MKANPLPLQLAVLIPEQNPPALVYANLLMVDMKASH